MSRGQWKFLCGWIGLAFGGVAAVGAPIQQAAPALPARPLNRLVRQFAEFAGQAPMAQEPQETPGESAAAASPPVVVESVPPAREVRPNELRFHLWDGNVITGDLGISEIVVRTEFGALTIPVAKVQSFRPGLDSFPARQTHIAQLVEALGAPDFQQRETARRELLGMGRLMHQEIFRFTDGDNSERKRHLDEIRKEFETQMDDLATDDEWGDDTQIQPLLRKDQIVTADFTIVGKIEPAAFQVASKYGPLTVQLADVRFADREQTGGLVRKTSVTVAGTDFAGSSMKSTGIRVERGDKISVRATGSISMTPWGNQAVVNPDGNVGYGNFEGHGGGTLLGRIGDGNEYIKLGSKASFTASKAGVLHLGIAVQTDYAQQGYQFPGEFKVKLVVEGQSSE